MESDCFPASHGDQFLPAKVIHLNKGEWGGDSDPISSKSKHEFGWLAAGVEGTRMVSTAVVTVRVPTVATLVLPAGSKFPSGLSSLSPQWPATELELQPER